MFQIVCSLSLSSAENLIVDVLEYCQQDPDDLDLHLTCDLVEYLMLKNNEVVYLSSTVIENSSLNAENVIFTEMESEMKNIVYKSDNSVDLASMMMTSVMSLIENEAKEAVDYERPVKMFLTAANLLLCSYKQNVTVSEYKSALGKRKDKELYVKLCEKLPNLPPEDTLQIFDILLSKEEAIMYRDSAVDFSMYRTEVTNILNTIIQSDLDLFDHICKSCWPRKVPSSSTKGYSSKSPTRWPKCNQQLSPDVVAALLAHASKIYQIVELEPKIYLFMECLSENFQATVKNCRYLSTERHFDIAIYAVTVKTTDYQGQSLT